MQDDKLIKTNADNQYHVHLEIKADDSVKIAALKKKIEEKEKILKQLSQGLDESKLHLENILSKKGTELMKEWGIFKIRHHDGTPDKSGSLKYSG